jgi:nitronate monooxygenase
MKSLKKAAFTNTYRTVWCAGPSIEHVTEILPIHQLVEKIVKEYENASIK